MANSTNWREEARPVSTIHAGHFGLALGVLLLLFGGSVGLVLGLLFIASAVVFDVWRRVGRGPYRPTLHAGRVGFGIGVLLILFGGSTGQVLGPILILAAGAFGLLRWMRRA